MGKILKIKKNDLKLRVFFTNKLTKSYRKQLLILKNKNYKYSIKEQENWFKKNIKTKDKHICLFFKSKIIGYNCLREKKAKIICKKKKNIVLYIFDTLLLDPQFRDLKLSKIIMKKSILLINKKNYISLLTCYDNMINYYKKFKWKIFSSNKVLYKEFIDRKKKIMIYQKNYPKKKMIKKIEIYE